MDFVDVVHTQRDGEESNDFYFGNQFRQASAKLLAYGILHMRGVGGKAEWVWLFVVMGRLIDHSALALMGSV